MAVVEEKIVAYLQCAISDIEEALAQMREAPDSNYYTKRKTRLMKAKIKIEKTLKKDYSGWI